MIIAFRFLWKRNLLMSHQEVWWGQFFNESIKQFSPLPHPPEKNPFPPEKSPHKRKRVIGAPERLMTGTNESGEGCATYLVTIKIISQFHDFPPPGGQAYKMYPQRAIYQRIKSE